MDGLVGIALLVGLAVLAMPVLLVVALLSLSRLKARMAVLEASVRELRLAVRVAPAAAPGEVAAAASAPAASGVTPATPAAPAQAVTEGPVTEPASPAAAPLPSTPAGAAEPDPAGASPGQDAGRAQPPPLPGTWAGPPGHPSEPVDAATRARVAAASTRVAHAPPPPPSPRPPPSRPAPPPAGPPSDAGAPLRALQRWFSVGNVPVKIGMLVSLVGVAALLKLAADRGLFSLPLELRLAAVAAVALAALVFAWRRREHNRVFALSLQGGAIGVLLLTVFAAFKLYHVLPAGAAFGLSVVLVAGVGLLAVLQDARALAVFALLAGFLAPLWLSTGSGNHVALFSYYALLNAAIVAIAWFRSWRILNLLGFFFTFGIGALWGAYGYRPEHYSSTQPFLLLFFLFYLVVPILFARRQPEGRRGLIDGCLLFGLPLVAFSLQAGLLAGLLPGASRMPLALCALGLGALYAGLAWALRQRPGYGVLRDAYAVLAVGFATLAVPLALSARATAAVFALEGAGLLWLGLRQGRVLPALAGTALQLLAGGALAIGFMDHAGADLRALFNPTAMGALLVALAGFASARSLRDHGQAGAAQAFYLWGLAWWAGNGLHEVARFADRDLQPDLLLVFAGLTAWLAAEVHRRQPARVLALTVAAAFALAMPLALWQLLVHAHPFGGSWGPAAWLLFALLGLRALHCLREHADGIAGAAQLAWWLAWPLALSLWGDDLAYRAGLGQGWRQALLALPWLVLAGLGLWRWAWLAFPRGLEANQRLRTPLLCVAFAVIACGWGLALTQSVASSPLPWMPLLNPAELAQLVALGLAAAWLWSPQAPAGLVPLRTAVVALGGFALLSVSTLRSVHHWGGIGWDAGLPGSGLAQTSLTVVWSVLGVVAWIIGSRRGRRGLWLAGAILMGVVLAKLLLVDRQHLGGMLGIVSFIAYGVLCTIVGYLAPAPPRAVAVSQGE